INDMVATGFISGMLIVPKFVLNEIQALADSQDTIKRSRARRGLDVLNQLHEQKNINLKIVPKDYPEIKGVDSKLIALAKEKHYAVFTNDYNLNKIARIEGVEVLNINDLVNALKPVLLPGEELELDIVKEGKEQGQGVGYLADGTMVVVANGASLVGKKMKVQVTSMLQTSAGRIIFTEVLI
ncbi:MAG: PIN/TRAM domain-containing protein, partial [Brevinema sp.]